MAEGMRFLHSGADARERAEREAFFARADSVIAEMRAACAGGDSSAGGRAVAELAASLHPDLHAVTLTDRPQGPLLVMTPRGERGLRPLAAAVVARANEGEGIRFASHRPAESFGQMREVVRRHGYELDNAQARAGFSRGHLLEVVVYGAGFGGTKDDAASFAAERALELLLGERVLDDWIGRVDVEPLPRGGLLKVLQRDGGPSFSLAELPLAVAAAVEGLSGELPDLTKLCASRDGWVLFEAEPEAAADYRAQDDIALAGSALPEMARCFLEGAPFSSLRFVRGGLSIAYLKIDTHGTPFEQRVNERVRLEDELAQQLSTQKLGAVVGNGLGLRYVYIDLALAPGTPALHAVCDVAQRAGVSRRSWIEFCDSDLSNEWLGVWPDSPPPPGTR